jgi:hypothetical protein
MLVVATPLAMVVVNAAIKCQSALAGSKIEEQLHTCSFASAEAAGLCAAIMQLLASHTHGPFCI